VSRIISLANYNYQNGDTKYEDLKNCADFGKCENAVTELKRGVRGAQADNYLTRILNGLGGLQIPFGKVDVAHLAVAKSKLEKYDLVVFVEYLDSSETAKQVDEVLGWHLKPRSRENPAKYAHHLTPKAWARLADMNEIDYELYNYALKKWKH